MLDDHPALSDDARWAAVVARDLAADGSFVLGVRTTGIYCRPTCPARRPKRENVAFYPDPAAARAAGFRACMRCEPDAEPERRLMAQAVTAAARLIEAAVADEAPAPTLDALAARAGYAPHHFHRMFKRATGVTPRAYAQRAARRPRRRGAGGGRQRDRDDPRRRLRFGQPLLRARPARGSAWRRRCAGRAAAARRSATRRRETSLGRVLVAATDRGVCAIRSARATRARGLAAPAVSEGGDRAGGRRLRRDARGGGRSGGAPRRGRGAAARPARHRVPGTGLAGAAGDPRWRDGELRRDRGGDRPADARRAGWRRPARRTRWRSRCPATGWCTRTARSRATAGASRARPSCWRASAARRDGGGPTMGPPSRHCYDSVSAAPLRQPAG